MEFIGPKTKEEINDYLKTRIESLAFSKRIENALINSGVRTIGGILRKDGDSLHEIEGIGLKGLEEIQKILSESFDIKIKEKNFQFKPKYYEVNSSIVNTKEQTEEERIKNESIEKEIKIIEDKYIENKEKIDFIYGVKIISLDLTPEIETTLLKNNILSVGGLLNDKGDNIKENIPLSNNERNSLLDIFDYFILKNKQIEEEQEELRKKEIELIGRLNRKLERASSLNTQKDIQIPTRNLNIFNLFRQGLTLDKIGILNNISRERVRQTIKSTLNKMGLDYEEEKNIISSKRNDLKPKKIIKEKKWGAHKYDNCVICNTTDFPHFRKGRCERCAGSFRGKMREKIISGHNNKCDNCDIDRKNAISEYKHDLFITKKQEVFCKICFLNYSGKTLGSYKNFEWSRFYPECKSCGTKSFPHVGNGLCINCSDRITNEKREKIISGHLSKCDKCNISRSESHDLFNRDLYITKSGEVLCKKCYLTVTSEILKQANKDKWKMFYN
jgi:hypothetical protein